MKKTKTPALWPLVVAAAVGALVWMAVEKLLWPRIEERVGKPLLSPGGHDTPSGYGVRPL